MYSPTISPYIRIVPNQETGVDKIIFFLIPMAIAHTGLKAYISKGNLNISFLPFLSHALGLNSIIQDNTQHVYDLEKYIYTSPGE